MENGNWKMENLQLQTPLTQAGRIYKMYASRLAKLDMYTVEDLLYHFPFRYDNFALTSKIAEVQPSELVTIHGQILSIENIYTRTRKRIQKALITDDTGSLEVVWYNQPYITQYLHTNDTIALSGKVDTFGRKITMISPQYERITPDSDTLHTGRLVPISPETKGVSSKWLRTQVDKLLKEFSQNIQDYIPIEILTQYAYPSLKEALERIHFPKTLDEAEKARERLGFDELLLIQLKAQQRRVDWEKDLVGQQFELVPYKEQLNSFTKSLPFTLTQSQTRAIDEILQDVTKTKPMNRLLQGDVGSGKTIVGAFIMYVAHLNGFQSVLMAPTEILAQQHYETIKRFLKPFGLKIALTTGSKKNIVSTPQPFDILIGTHAVLNEKIHFNNLGLVVIDEQQRFGVEQRSSIREKGSNPHFLTMTATPIPRTVALTMYGELDVSYLSDMPKGRKHIKTWLVPKEKREGAYHWIHEQIVTHQSQIFIICPFIEESENMTTIKAAKVEFERLKTEVFPDVRLGMLHGKLKKKEKDQILQEFRQKKYDILVATPVVEVGIDIPNATVILIEASERFGLSQLHQLRGRVGRGDKQSYCLLFTESPSPTTITRLKAMETKHSGAELAELDLKLRGPGDLFGTSQSGIPKLKVARFSDYALVQRTKQEAKILFNKLARYPKLAEKVTQITERKVSPD